MRSSLKALDSQVDHVPVLIEKVLEALQPLNGRTIVDGTFGAGGYTKAILAQGAHVIGIDRDPNAYNTALELQKQFPDQFTAIHAAFADMDVHVADRNITQVDGITLDIGVSSMQLDQPERGFSFLRDGPLDMRMAQSGVSAHDVINRASEKALAHIIFVYGEEKRARSIAKAICAARENGPINTTLELANLIKDTLGPGPKNHHPATKTFQALRIAINGELEQLVTALFAAEKLLVPGGKLAVVSFHSLEDRIVKKFLSSGHAAKPTSRYAPPSEETEITFEDVAKPVKPSKDELEANPRARSAILRAATRSSSPARELSHQGLGLPGRLNKNDPIDAPIWGELS